MKRSKEARILNIQTLKSPSLLPRGGASLSLLPTSNGDESLLTAFGGADRNGVQFSLLDVFPVTPTSKEFAEATSEKKTSSISWSEARHQAGRETSHGDPLPKLAGHAAVTIWDKLLVFGGINFNEAEVYDKLYEVSVTLDGEGSSSSPSSISSSPSYSYVSREITPSGTKPAGRTGHSFVVVPPTIILPPSATSTSSSSSSSSSSDASLSSSSPCHLSTLPSGLHVNDDDSVRIIYLFGGSTPTDGTLNDLFRLKVSRSLLAEEKSTSVEEVNQHPPSSYSYTYEWEEIGTNGDTPLPRELHNAFIRPAVVQLAHAKTPLETSSLELSASKEADPLVFVVQDPLLIIHGGRQEDKDGMPMTTRDLAFLNLNSLSWTCLPLASDKNQRFYSASAASCQTRDGLIGFAVGGQDTAEGEICNALFIYDLRFGVYTNQSSGESISLDLPRVPTQQHFETLIQKRNLPEHISSRFAAAAATSLTFTTSAPSSLLQTDESEESLDIVTVYAFGGMAHIEDLSELVKITISI